MDRELPIEKCCYKNNFGILDEPGKDNFAAVRLSEESVKIELCSAVDLHFIKNIVRLSWCFY